uniref:Uncharacterized protein n=1 Tax=Anguilla anguilla TaxID=7936 RepID=A0A0E9TW55_ANGAN
MPFLHLAITAGLQIMMLIEIHHVHVIHIV